MVSKVEDNSFRFGITKSYFITIKELKATLAKAKSGRAMGSKCHPRFHLQSW